MKLGLYLDICRLPLCRVGCNLLIRFSLWKYLLGFLLKSVGSVCSRDFFKHFEQQSFPQFF